MKFLFTFALLLSVIYAADWKEEYWSGEDEARKKRVARLQDLDSTTPFNPETVIIQSSKENSSNSEQSHPQRPYLCNSVTFLTLCSSSEDLRRLKEVNVESCIPQDCMHSYHELFPTVLEQPDTNTIEFDKKSVLFFEPVPSFRHLNGVQIIQSIGPIFFKDRDYDVVPVWLRTGKLVFYYRLHNDSHWKPVLQYGSTADVMPFFSDASLLTINSICGAIYADSAILEKAVFELYVMEQVLGFPAAVQFSDWKVFYVLYGLRSDDSVNTTVVAKLQKLADKYDAVKSASPIPQSVVVPMRDERGWKEFGLTQWSRVCANSVGTERAIIKAGGTVTKFPNVLNVPLKDFVEHCKRIPTSPLSMSNFMLLSVFENFFGQVLGTLKVWSEGIVVIRIDPTSIDLPESAFDKNDLRDLEGVRFDFIEQGSLPSALGPIYPLYYHARKVSESNPIGSDMLLIKAAYRLAIMIAGEEGLRLLKEQDNRESIVEKYKLERLKFLCGISRELKIGYQNVSAHLIFYMFAMYYSGKYTLTSW